MAQCAAQLDIRTDLLSAFASRQKKVSETGPITSRTTHRLHGVRIFSCDMHARSRSGRLSFDEMSFSVVPMCKDSVRDGMQFSDRKKFH